MLQHRDLTLRFTERSQLDVTVDTLHVMGPGEITNTFEGRSFAEVLAGLGSVLDAERGAQPEPVVEIARCPVHGLHGARTECHVCGGAVEQVRMVPAP